MSHAPFVVGGQTPDCISATSNWFVVRDYHPLIRFTGCSAKIPSFQDLEALDFDPNSAHFLGYVCDAPYYTVEVPDTITAPGEMEFVNLRQLHGIVDERHWALAGKAVQIVDWDRTHRFCGRCGTPTPVLNGEHAKRCPACGLVCYPRLSPAIIVLVYRDNRMLLGKSSRRSSGFYSTLAGFVEPGESLEETVAREIYEESGIHVQNITYFGSQPWPFPNSLMIGFTAAYASGAIRLLDGELADARWFTVDDLPTIPSKISISRSLIDWFIERQGGSIE